MFITLEGMEGAGKSTLAEGLSELFRREGKAVCLTREPGGCGLGETLRHVLLNTASRVTPETELFLFLADRAQHVADVIRPALDAGEVVISDRYADSTIVYQGYGRGFDKDALYRLNHLAVRGLWPHKTLVLDVPPEEGVRRAIRRNEKVGSTAAEGRFEAEELAFHIRVRDGFRDWALKNAPRCVLLDATLSPERLLDAAWAALKRDWCGQARGFSRGE